VAVYQPNLRLFADSDSRAQYGYRLITGAYTSSLWRMTFGYAPPIEWDARIKGRAAEPGTLCDEEIPWSAGKKGSNRGTASGVNND
jgi:hypothetical protein